MNVWVIGISDAIPGETWGQKRSLAIVDVLQSQGHQVIFWASNFVHVSKTFRSRGWQDIKVSSNFGIILVPVPAYNKHVSLARLKYMFVFAWRLYRRAMSQDAPDAIVLCVPSPGADFVAVRLAKHFRARLIVDFRDLWPELFVSAFPKSLHSVAPAVLSPLLRLRRYAFRNADAIAASNETYLKVALNDGNANVKSKVIFDGVDVQDFREKLGLSLSQSSLHIEKHPEEVWAIYAGTLGDNYDILSILEAAAILCGHSQKYSEIRKRIKILIAGDGPLRQKVMDFISTQRSSNLFYVGVLTQPELCSYYRLCDVGLLTYSLHSTVVFPLKVFDYFAAGLAVVNSIVGEIGEFLHDHQIGIQYEAGNPRSLADALLTLATDNDRRSMMARNSYDAAMQFDKSVQYNKFVALIEKVLADDEHNNG